MSVLSQEDPKDMSSPMSAAASSTQYIEAKNDLRKKVKEIKSRSPGADPVKRAEAALAILSTHFDDWMRDEIRTMSETHEAWMAAGCPVGDKRESFYRSIHDLKGQATTLGFPLATQVAASLCALLERIPGQDHLPVELVGQHVDAIRAIVREKAKDENDRVGARLANALAEAAGGYIGMYGTRDEDDDGEIIRDL